MEKYDDYVDNESAYEVLTAEAVKAEAAAEEEADRKIREKEEAAAEKQRLKEEEAAKKRLQKLEDEERRRQQKLEDQALRKKERQQEKAEADARRRADRIEAELLAVGASVLTRGLLGGTAESVEEIEVMGAKNIGASQIPTRKVWESDFLVYWLDGFADGERSCWRLAARKALILRRIPPT